MKTLQNDNDVRAALRIAKTETLMARSLATEMDAEIAAVKARFEHKIKAATDAATAELKAVEVFAAAHRAELFPDAKSATLDGHVIGFRDTPGAVKMVKGVTEKKFLERLLKRPGLARLFTRNKPALDKEAIKARWERWKAPLTKLGARIVTEEVFFCELDVTPDPKPE